MHWAGPNRLGWSRRRVGAGLSRSRRSWTPDRVETRGRVPGQGTHGAGAVSMRETRIRKWGICAAAAAAAG